MPSSTSAPTGTITLVFTDIQGSTEMWERHGDDFHPQLIAHNRILREQLIAWHGYEVKTEGDAFMVAFEKASDALQWAVAAQRALGAHSWPETVGTLRVRMGMHTGEPLIGTDPEGKVDYFGPMVNRSARVGAAGHGGQILVSLATWQLARGKISGLDATDLGTHRLKGLDDPEQILQIVAPDLPRDFAPLKTLDAYPHNLQRQLTNFVGRDEEARHLRALLRSDSTRLVTLLGPGGTGKTRLSQHVAADLLESFPDGVWFVELEQVADAEHVPQAIASALNFSPETGPGVEAQVIAHLARKRLLVLLDNFERVTEAARFLDALLRGCPELKLLVTSRSVLHVPGEQVVPLAPLAVPPETAAWQELARFDSVNLFVERSRLANPRWTLHAQNAAPVVAICRKLDGVPLAIELAAARMNALTPPQILQRLENRFGLLESQLVGLPERQRTLRGAIDWSYNMLAEHEQRVFARLSVFCGGLFIDAAEAVGGEGALEALMELRDQSLFHTREAAGQMRYVMLESLREYAAEKLGEGAEAARTRHAEHFLQTAQRLAQQLRSPAESEALELVSLEMDNFRAAWEWTRAQHHEERLARFGLALGELLRRRGWWRERFAWLLEAVGAAERSGTLAPAELAELQYALGFAHQERGEYEPAQRLFRASLETRRQLEDPTGEAECLNRLGNLAHLQGDFDEARQVYEEALLLRQMMGDHDGESALLNNLGVLAVHQNDLDTAHRRFEESLTIDRHAGNDSGAAHMLNNLGRIAYLTGDLEEATRRFEEARELAIRLGDHWLLAHVRHNEGDLALARKSVGPAKSHYREALLLRRELDVKPEIAETLLGLGQALLLEQKWTEATMVLTAVELVHSETHSLELEPIRAELQRIREAVGADRFGQLQRMAQRFSLLQVVERALTM